MTDFKLLQISSLEKVYLDSDEKFIEINKASALKGERFSYQLAFKSNRRAVAKIEINSPLAEYITIRIVGNVPSELPCYPDCGQDYERKEAGLFPDVLYPLEDNCFLVKPNNFYSLWITAEIPENVKEGSYNIEAHIFEKIFRQDEDLIDEKINLKLNVINACLPEQKIKYNQWFHSDCIANYYNVPVFSQKYWELVEKFMAMAVRTGVNMILTPIFTPPLDTAVGGERLTVQLVDVYFDGEKYKFSFDKLRKWIETAKKCGMKYFEMSHLFSQWGAVSTPKTIADVNGEIKRIFGWETSATSDEYKFFLQSFLPELINVIKDEKIKNVTYFHVSDEPSEEQLESYSAAKNIVADMLKDFAIIDALSEYEFYEKGVVTTPIPNEDQIESFIEKGVERRWTYYCCGQGRNVSNRFFGMPLSRTRAIGIPLYKFDIEGFLQWGYNFYNSAQSLRSINPYLVTDADSAFPSGDAFTVYPYDDGPIESIRAVSFYEGLQDMRALELLGSIIGRDKLIEKLEKKFGEISFSTFPRGAENMMKFREEINRMIEKSIK